MAIFVGYEWLLPQFGIIDDIIIIDSVPYFAYFHLETLCFNHHYHSYEITHYQPKQVDFTKYYDLPDCHPLSLSKIAIDPFSKFICVKYHLHVAN